LPETDPTSPRIIPDCIQTSLRKLYAISVGEI
jgi:hypothetical protein